MPLQGIRMIPEANQNVELCVIAAKKCKPSRMWETGPQQKPHLKAAARMAVSIVPQ